MTNTEPTLDTIAVALEMSVRMQSVHRVIVSQEPDYREAELIHDGRSTYAVTSVTTSSGETAVLRSRPILADAIGLVSDDDLTISRERLEAGVAFDPTMLEIVMRHAFAHPESDLGLLRSMAESVCRSARDRVAESLSAYLSPRYPDARTFVVDPYDEGGWPMPISVEPLNGDVAYLINSDDAHHCARWLTSRDAGLETSAADPEDD